jgi:hypothetical protein
MTSRGAVTPPNQKILAFGTAADSTDTAAAATPAQAVRATTMCATPSTAAGLLSPRLTLGMGTARRVSTRSRTGAAVAGRLGM